MIYQKFYEEYLFIVLFNFCNKIRSIIILWGNKREVEEFFEGYSLYINQFIFLFLMIKNFKQINFILIIIIYGQYFLFQWKSSDFREDLFLNIFFVGDYYSRFFIFYYIGLYFSDEVQR